MATQRSSARATPDISSVAIAMTRVVPTLRSLSRECNRTASRDGASAKPRQAERRLVAGCARSDRLTPGDQRDMKAIVLRRWGFDLAVSVAWDRATPALSRRATALRRTRDTTGGALTAIVYGGPAVTAARGKGS